MNNTGWSHLSWSTDHSDTGLLSVYFLMVPDLFPFVLLWLILDVTNMNDPQRDTSSFKSRNLDGINPSSDSLNMDFGWKWDNLSGQDLNYCCKGDNIYVKMIL